MIFTAGRPEPLPAPFLFGSDLPTTMTHSHLPLLGLVPAYSSASEADATKLIRRCMAVDDDALAAWLHHPRDYRTVLAVWVPGDQHYVVTTEATTAEPARWSVYEVDGHKVAEGQVAAKVADLSSHKSAYRAARRWLKENATNTTTAPWQSHLLTDGMDRTPPAGRGVNPHRRRIGSPSQPLTTWRDWPNRSPSSPTS